MPVPTVTTTAPANSKDGSSGAESGDSTATTVTVTTTAKMWPFAGSDKLTIENGANRLENSSFFYVSAIVPDPIAVGGPGSSYYAIDSATLRRIDRCSSAAAGGGGGDSVGAVMRAAGGVVQLAGVPFTGDTEPLYSRKTVDGVGMEARFASISGTCATQSSLSIHVSRCVLGQR